MSPPKGAEKAIGYGINPVMAAAPGLPPLGSMPFGAALCILLLMLAIFLGWGAPTARWAGSPDREADR